MSVRDPVPMAGAHLMISEDGGYFVLGQPAGDGVPEGIWAVQYEGNQYLPVFIPDQVMVGEYGGEYGNAFDGAGEDIRPVIDLEEFDDDVRDIPPVFDLEEFDDDVQHIMNAFDLEDDDNDTDDSSVWSDRTDVSSDSGYGSMSEEEEEEEDEEDAGEYFRRGSPLDQEFPPDDFWQGWRQVDLSAVVSPLVQAGLPSAGPLVPAHGPAGPAVPADPPVSAGPVREEPAPSTSGLGSSTKRSREESPAAQQRAKRQRRDNGDVDDQQPSTSSGLCSFPVRGYWPAPYDGSDSDHSDSD